MLESFDSMLNKYEVLHGHGPLIQFVSGIDMEQDISVVMVK